MKEQEKREIALRLRSYIRRQGSQARAAKAMGIGAATVSAVLKEDWVSVSEEMLRKIDSHTRVSSEWTLVETGVYQEMTQVMDDARRDCDYTWIIGVPGCGKSCTAEDYAAAVGLDKKGAGEDISVILLERMGRAVPHRMPKAQLLEELR